MLCVVSAAGVGERAFSAGGDFDFIQQRMASTVEENAQVSTGLWGKGAGIHHYTFLMCCSSEGAHPKAAAVSSCPPCMALPHHHHQDTRQ